MDTTERERIKNNYNTYMPAIWKIAKQWINAQKNLLYAD